MTNRRVALVTGSSRGLGRHIAMRLAGDGFAVAVNGLHEEGRTEDVAAEIGEAGGLAQAFAADVTDEGAVAGLVRAVEGALGPVSVLVLNATGPQPEAPLEDVEWHDHLAQLDLFVKSPVLLGRAVVPGMRERGWGRIVEIDSEVVDAPPPGRSAYVTAKSAQLERHADVLEDVKDAYLATVPTGRMGSPEDVAHAVAFFASEAAGFITGQRLVVDGGRGLGP